MVGYNFHDIAYCFKWTFIKKNRKRIEKEMDMKKYQIILGLFLLFVVGCSHAHVSDHGEKHATEESVEHCFEDHSDDPSSYEETLEHCKEEICGDDVHCFEEVEELSINIKNKL